jgi:uncharacterized membrane protein
MKKILISFAFGLVLSALPITGLAFSGNKLSNVVENVFNVTRLIAGGCPQTISVPVTIQQGDLTIEADVTCTLTGESPDNGSGVSVCSYSCIVGM